MSLYVDCSSNNGTPNVAAYAAAGHTKLSVKVSEGAGYHWYGGEDVIDQAHRHGLVVEHYHWLRPDSDVKAQADFFLRYVEKRWRHGDNAMTDCEVTYGAQDPSPDRRADQLAAFQERIKARLAEPVVYLPNWYCDNKPALIAEGKRWAVVASDYSGGDTVNNRHGFRLVAWQFTSSAHVAGFAGRVDYNRTLTDTGSTSGAGVDTGSHHQISTSTSPQEAASMYEILYDQTTKVWYAWAPGYWHRFTSATELQFMANRAGCINGAAVRRVLATPAKKRAKALEAFGFGNAHTVMVKNFARKG